MGGNEQTSTIRTNLGARIREIHLAQNLTQETLGLMTGLDRTYILAIEKGRRNVSVDNLGKIAAGLGITLSELFRGVEGAGVPVVGTRTRTYHASLFDTR